METLKVLLEPPNLIFCLSLLIALMLLCAVLISGGDTDTGDAEADIDTDVDVGADIGTEVEINAEAADTSHSVYDVPVPHHDHGDANLIGKTVSLLGIGKMPVMMVLFSWTLFFGGIGLLLNLVVWNLWTVSIFIALGGSICITSFFAQMWKKFMPKPRSYATSPKNWIGLDATVDLKVDRTFGTAYFYDQNGVFQQITVVLDSSVDQNITALKGGDTITLLKYDSEEKRFTCQPKKQEEVIIN